MSDFDFIPLPLSSQRYQSSQLYWFPASGHIQKTFYWPRNAFHLPFELSAVCRSPTNKWRNRMRIFCLQPNPRNFGTKNKESYIIIYRDLPTTHYKREKKRDSRAACSTTSNYLNPTLTWLSAEGWTTRVPSR